MIKVVNNDTHLSIPTSGIVVFLLENTVGATKKWIQLSIPTSGIVVFLRFWSTLGKILPTPSLSIPTSGIVVFLLEQVETLADDVTATLSIPTSGIVVFLREPKSRPKRIPKRTFHPDERDCGVSTRKLSPHTPYMGQNRVRIFPSRRAGLWCFYCHI
jgi:hypothetical protein